MIGNRSSRPNGDLTACMFVASGEPMHKPVTISDMIGRKGLIILASGGANLYRKTNSNQTRHDIAWMMTQDDHDLRWQQVFTYHQSKKLIAILYIRNIEWFGCYYILFECNSSCHRCNYDLSYVKHHCSSIHRKSLTQKKAGEGRYYKHRCCCGQGSHDYAQRCHGWLGQKGCIVG